MNGVWFYKGKVVIDLDDELCEEIVHDHHCTPSSGHSGYYRTIKRINETFWWTRMKYMIKKKVRCCDICQRSKGESISPPRLLGPLPMSEHV